MFFAAVCLAPLGFWLALFERIFARRGRRQGVGPRGGDDGWRRRRERFVGVSTLVPRPILGASGFAVSLATYVLAAAIAKIARAYVVLLARRFFWAAAC